MKYCRFLLFSFFAGLSACASWHWEKRGSGEEDYLRDEKFCKVQSYSGTDGMVTQASVRKMHTCLELRGWRKVQN